MDRDSGEYGRIMWKPSQRYGLMAGIALLLVLAGVHSLLKRDSAPGQGMSSRLQASDSLTKESSHRATGAADANHTQLKKMAGGNASASLSSRGSRKHLSTSEQAQAASKTPLSEQELQKLAEKKEYYAAQGQAEVHGGDETEKTRQNIPENNLPVNNSYPVQKTFDDAASEFGVPADLLKAVAYVETHGEQRSGKASIDGGYGVMNLRESSMSGTLDEAAKLLGVSPELLKSDPVLNVRGAAALLKAYHDDAAALNSSSNPWISAVTLYSGFTDQQSVDYANRIQTVLQQGVNHQTTFGQPMTIQPNQQTLLSSAQKSSADNWGGVPQ